MTSNQDTPSGFTQSLQRWRAETPVVSQYVVVISIIGLVFGVMGLWHITINCPTKVISSFQLFRPFLASIFAVSFMDVFGYFGVFYYTKMLEFRRGSLFTFFLLIFFICSVEWIFTLLGYVLLQILPESIVSDDFDAFNHQSSAGSGSVFGSETIGSDSGSINKPKPLLMLCCGGPWALFFALLTYEARELIDAPRFLQSSEEQQRAQGAGISNTTGIVRKFLCFPLNVQLKYFPLCILLLFSLLSGISLSNFIAYGVAYYTSKFRSLHPLSTIASWEDSSILSFLSTAPRFIQSNSSAMGGVRRLESYASANNSSSSSNFSVSGGYKLGGEKLDPSPEQPTVSGSNDTNDQLENDDNECDNKRSESPLDYNPNEFTDMPIK